MIFSVFPKKMGFGVFLVHPPMTVLLSSSVERCFVSHMRDFLMFSAKNACMFFMCFYLHWSRDSVSPVCEIFFIPCLRWKLVISYSYFSICKIIVLAFLHTLIIIHSWDRVVISLTVSQSDFDFCTNQPPPTLYLWHNNLLLHNCNRFYSINCIGFQTIYKFKGIKRLRRSRDLFISRN